MSKRSSAATNWLISGVRRETFRGGRHKPRKIGRTTAQGVTQQYCVKFVFKGNFYRRPITSRKQKQQRYEKPPPPQLPIIPAQPLGVPKAFKEPPPIPSVVATPISHQHLRSSSNQQTTATWSWRSWFTLNTPLIILNFGSMATLLGFTRSDVLELRSLALTGNCTFIVYSLISPPIKWPAIMWSMLFASVNGYNIAKILNERQGKVILTPHEQEIYNEHFQPHGVTQYQFYKVLTTGHSKIIPAGNVISRMGEPITSVKLVVSGKTRAKVGFFGRHLTAIGSSRGNRFRNVGGDSGAWIGEMAFLQSVWDMDHHQHDAPSPSTTSSSKSSQPSSKDMTAVLPSSSSSLPTSGEPGADVTKSKLASTLDDDDDTTMRFISTIVAVEQVEIIEWSFEEMHSLLKVSNDMQRVLTRAMTAAIVGKVVNFMVSSSRHASYALPQWPSILRIDRFVSSLEVEEEEEEEEDNEEDEISSTVAKKKRFRWV